jgi:hypothetical protein
MVMMMVIFSLHKQKGEENDGGRAVERPCRKKTMTG